MTYIHCLTRLSKWGYMEEYHLTRMVTTETNNGQRKCCIQHNFGRAHKLIKYSCQFLVSVCWSVC